MVVAVAGGLGALFFGARCVYMILYGIAEARGYLLSPVKAGLVTALILIALAFLIGRISGWILGPGTS